MINIIAEGFAIIQDIWSKVNSLSPSIAIRYATMRKNSRRPSPSRLLVDDQGWCDPRQVTYPVRLWLFDGEKRSSSFCLRETYDDEEVPWRRPAAKCNFKRTADKCAMRSTLIAAQRLDRVSHKEKRVTARMRRSILSREYLDLRRETNGRDERENNNFISTRAL